MFSFRKKDKEKDKEKKEKDKGDKKKKEKDEKQDKKREKKERQNMTPEEISRLEEMKRGVGSNLSDRQERKPASFKSYDHSYSSQEYHNPGSGDVAATGPAVHGRVLTKPKPLPRQVGTNKPNASPPPAVKPKPKVKSILKGPAPPPIRGSVDLNDSRLLEENTRRNEDLFTPTHSTPSASSPMSTQGSEASSIGASSSGTTPSTPANDLSEYIMQEDSKKAEPDYVSKLKLPPLIPPKPPRVRDIVVKRNQSGGFGFSLRKGLIPVRGGGLPNVVTFAEPGSGPSSRQTGLLPGDRLIEVCYNLC